MKATEILNTIYSTQHKTISEFGDITHVLNGVIIATNNETIYCSGVLTADADVEGVVQVIADDVNIIAYDQRSACKGAATLAAR